MLPAGYIPKCHKLLSDFYLQCGKFVQFGSIPSIISDMILESISHALILNSTSFFERMKFKWMFIKQRIAVQSVVCVLFYKYI